MKAKMGEMDEIWAIYRRNLGQNSRWNINISLKSISAVGSKIGSNLAIGLLYCR